MTATTPASRALAALDSDGAFDFPDELLALARAAVAERVAWEPGGGGTLAAREAKEAATDALIAALAGDPGGTA